MMETVTLPEVVHKVNEEKIHQNFGNNLAAWVSGLIQVYVDIYHQYGVLEPEVLQGLL